MKPPENYKIEIEARIQEQIQAEVTGDAAALYDLILPAIREKRERERTDEPQLTIDSITDFLASIETAELGAFQIAEFHPKSELYGSNPAIKVEYSVYYNEQTKTSFSSIWVKYLGQWYSTALGKFRLPKNA
nr:hypothetical protein [uncultured Pseudomonas sp.]